jgi:hypothetical protein
MPKITPEQLEAFREFEKARAGKAISDEALRGVVEDDIKESDEKAAKRLGYSREYNHAPGAAEPRLVAEKDLDK